MIAEVSESLTPAARRSRTELPELDSIPRSNKKSA
jgi:hypothetical protein